jgi:hypothetical protein
VDRGALDAALGISFPCGGWCPAGRIAEDGPIAATYPLVELKAGGYRQRTVRSVSDSDGTVVIHFGEIEGGTALTVEQCALQRKPYQLIDAERTSVQQAAATICGFVETHSISILNVAGPRQSLAPRAHQYARAVLELVLKG